MTLILPSSTSLSNLERDFKLRVDTASGWCFCWRFRRCAWNTG